MYVMSVTKPGAIQYDEEHALHANAKLHSLR